MSQKYVYYYTFTHGLLYIHVTLNKGGVQIIFFLYSDLDFAYLD